MGRAGGRTEQLQEEMLGDGVFTITTWGWLQGYKYTSKPTQVHSFSPVLRQSLICFLSSVDSLALSRIWRKRSHTVWVLLSGFFHSASFLQSIHIAVFISGSFFFYYLAVFHCVSMPQSVYSPVTRPWVVSVFWLLQINMPWAFTCKCLYEHTL